MVVTLLLGVDVHCKHITLQLIDVFENNFNCILFKRSVCVWLGLGKDIQTFSRVL